MEKNEKTTEEKEEEDNHKTTYRGPGINFDFLLLALAHGANVFVNAATNVANENCYHQRNAGATCAKAWLFSSTTEYGYEHY